MNRKSMEPKTKTDPFAKDKITMRKRIKSQTIPMLRKAVVKLLNRIGNS